MPRPPLIIPTLMSQTPRAAPTRSVCVVAQGQVPGTTTAVVAEPPELFPDERVGALPVPVLIVHWFVAFHEGPNLPDAA